MRGSLEVRFIVHDAMRRLEYNLHELLAADDQSVGHKSRSKNEIRMYTFSNFLSSLYSMQDVMKAYFVHIGSKQEFIDAVEKALDQDELMNYVRQARNTQDHSIKPAAFRAVTPIISAINPGRQVWRGEPELRDLSVQRGTKTIPVPKNFLGKPLESVTLETVAQSAFTWWAIFMDGLEHETFVVPGP